MLNLSHSYNLPLIIKKHWIKNFPDCAPTSENGEGGRTFLATSLYFLNWLELIYQFQKSASVLQQEAIPVGCKTPTCTDQRCVNSCQMSALGGNGVPCLEKGWRGLTRGVALFREFPCLGGVWSGRRQLYSAVKCIMGKWSRGTTASVGRMTHRS